jgi:hypothetical protein
MIDRLESPVARPADHLVVSPPPPVALEYQPPQPRQRRTSDMIWGLIISVLIANGVGWMIFGSLMMMGQRDDHAGPVAVGAAFIVFGAGLAGSLAWTRRRQPQQSLRNLR